jgi:hypothetical protein
MIPDRGLILITRLSVDITIPVLNEEQSIESSLDRLASFLSADFPYDWCITVADNGSTDRTWSLANSVAATNAHTRVTRLNRPRRGGELKAAWSTSTEDIAACMDVDLSTGLASLRPCSSPSSGAKLTSQSVLASARGAVIERSVQRKVISRLYNVITRRFLDTRFVTLTVAARHSGQTSPETSSGESRMMVGSSTPSFWSSRGERDCGSTRFRCVGWRTTILECGS